MKELEYKNFSLKFHQKNWRQKKPNVCQFELTFNCTIDCRHCYASCYKKRELFKRELTTQQVFKILDKIEQAGVFWLCFTGGDPLARPDFLKIYDYAQNKGFVVTIFTNGTLIDEKIARHFQKFSPFSIEITLNGVTKKTYENISGVKGSFKKVIAGIERLRKRKIPFKIKTLATSQNYKELDKIKKFVEKMGQKFQPSSLLFVRLNGDLMPAKYRLKPEEVLALNKKYKINSLDEKELRNPLSITHYPYLFRCAAGNDTFHINAYGKMFLCSTVREPSVNLLTDEIADGLKLFKKIKAQKFKTNSKCKNCPIKSFCLSCPGRAKLETGDAEKPIEYFCRLAHLVYNTTALQKNKCLNHEIKN